MPRYLSENRALHMSALLSAPLSRSMRCALPALAFILGGLAAPGDAHAQPACSETYVIRSGDTLHEIAQRCGTTVDALLEANPQISSPDRIEIGWSVTIAGGTPAEPGEDDTIAEGPVEPAAGDAIQGVLTDEGIECPTLRTAAGDLYSLAGDISPYRSGNRVRIVGQRPDMSICQQGTTITVELIEGID